MEEACRRTKDAVQDRSGLPQLEIWAIQGAALEKEAVGLACGGWSQPCTEDKCSRDPEVQTALE